MRRWLSGLWPVWLCLLMAACAAPNADRPEADPGPEAQPAPLVVPLKAQTYLAYMDQQARRLKAMFAEELRDLQVDMERLDDGGIRLIIAADGLFAADGQGLDADAVLPLQKLADVAGLFDRTVVHVIGHLEAATDRAVQRQRSADQARVVLDWLVQRGLPPFRLRAEGRGGDHPWVTNATEAGRRMNRRIEIVLRAVVEGQGDAAWRPPAPVDYPL